MQNPETAPPTVLDRLKQAIESAAVHNPNDADAPIAILWADQESRWQSILPQLRRLMPQLLTFGDFKPEERSGPAVWLRYEIDRPGPSDAAGTIPIPVIYLPGVSRQVLGTADTCPKHLKPLVELQYRGLCWMQKNGRDWTVEAFLASSNGGLGLDLAQDNATRQSMQWALSELAATSVQALAGRRLEAEDFDRLFSDDPARDLLTWLNDPKGAQAGWGAGRWQAFVSRCKQDFGLDPERDGEVVAAERLGEREGPWQAVWRRFAEAPALHPNLPALLRRAMPLLPSHASSWPQRNEQDEDALRKALSELGSKAPAIARKEVLELEKVHGIRRDWAWATLGQAPLAQALQPLAELSERTASELGGASPNDMARLYVDGAWRVDDAALRSYAAVKTAADSKAIAAALNAIYHPWLDAAARHLQALAENQPLPSAAQLTEHEAPEQMAGDEGMQVIPSTEHLAEANAAIEPGTLMLFADGLRFDVAQRLISRLQANGRAVQASIRWAGLPTVTATAKPAVSPVAAQIGGEALGEDFLPIAADTQKPLTTDRFRKLLAAEGFEYLNAAETGDPLGPRLDGNRGTRQARTFAASQARRQHRRASELAGGTHRIPVARRLAGSARGHGSRLAVAARRSAQGRSSQIPYPKPLGALRRHQRFLQGRGAHRALALERPGTGCHRPRHRLLHRRQRIRPRRPEPAGNGGAGAAGRGRRRRAGKAGANPHRRRFLDRFALPGAHQARHARLVRGAAHPSGRRRFQHQPTKAGGQRRHRRSPGCQRRP